ncbi:hypothetical protein OBBRIDRAFT_887972 [Obba rivulosa]|uniref:SMP-LTD domain-containing protein n=1 Tax=Obba rivulosa TaxID=1052685 RepID=A0A8E2ASA0_9APHY|nr:hypothetical protein OBBRIDRAFT_887972 [Obba rivulosa]
MLSRLARGAASVLGVSFDADDCSGAREDVLLVNMDELRALVRPLPDIAWAKVADACMRTISPVCRVVSHTLHDDVEEVVRLLADLDSPLGDIPEDDTVNGDGPSNALPSNAHPTSVLATSPDRLRRKRRRSSVAIPIVIAAADPSLPTIVITLCPSQPRDSACLVPYQDASFGNRLAVPSHPVLNAVFPPLVAKPSPLVEQWRYESGHWRGLLPDPEEQLSKGMFSRPLPARRQKSCLDLRTYYATPRRAAQSRSAAHRGIPPSSAQAGVWVSRSARVIHVSAPIPSATPGEAHTIRPILGSHLHLPRPPTFPDQPSTLIWCPNTSQMYLKALVYAYVLGGLTFIPLLILAAVFYTIYTSVPVPETTDAAKLAQLKAEDLSEADVGGADPSSTTAAPAAADVNDLPKVRRGWLTVRRTFKEPPADASYVGMVRGFIDARSKDPKRSRPKDMWYTVLKGKVLYLYEDEGMTECEAAIELGGHEVAIFPEGLLDGELFTRRNAICLRPKVPPPDREMPSATKEMRLQDDDVEEKIEEKVEEKGGSATQRLRERERLVGAEKLREEAREEALDVSTPWFIFVRSVVDMEDWYLALVHASEQPANSHTLDPLQPVFQPGDMNHLVETLDEQPDVIPMRWLNALIGRLFFSYYRTQALEAYIIGRFMKKLSKIKRPGFLSDIVVKEVSVGNKAPTFSKPMLKELTKEGDASLEVQLLYKGEFRVTVEATAIINLGARFKTYTVKLVLALVLRELEGNMLIKVKRPPSSRIWYAFTQMPRIVLDVEPVVSDRQITWGMILSTIESRVKEVIQESVVLPNMDDISFFDSSKYQHRGGIWADASRQDVSPPSVPSQPSPAQDDRSIVSAPAADSSKVNDDVGCPSLPERSHSAEEVPGEPVLEPGTRFATTSEATSPFGSSPMRRRTWFGSQDMAAAASSSSSFGAGPSEISRGRSSDSESSKSRRSVSTPSSKESVAASTDTLQPLDEDTGEYLAPAPARRSPSTHSRSSAGNTEDGWVTSASESEAPMSRAKPNSSSSSWRNPPNSPTSFLQTLKSRAGDKQALSNTAKEAMRKWGVNWGGLKRENGSGNSVSGSVDEGTAEAAQGEWERAADSRSHRARPSYAEVRAHVVQRKERERGEPGDSTQRVDQQPSRPIPVPQSDKGKEGSPSPASSQDANRLAPAYPSGGSLSPSTSPRPEPRSVSPLHRAESLPPLAPDEPEQPPSPVRTQPPPPKSMTIPGIHASHRGEVMSLGYAPPAPPPEQKKAPAIQSVYRLWKNPAAQNQPPAQQQQRAPESPPQPVQVQAGFAGRDQDAHAPPASPAAQPQEKPAPPDLPERPAAPQPGVPPPLPPRTNSTRALGKPAAAPEVVKLVPSPELGASPPSPASAALQSIVSKDRTRRASLPASPERPGAGADESARSSPGLGPSSPPAPSPLANGEPDVAAPLSAPPRVPPALPPRRAPAPVSPPVSS